MTISIKKFKFILVFFTITTLLFATTSCKKTAVTIDSTAFFNTNILDKTLTIHLATDNGTTITSNYSSYTFKCVSGGIFTATNNLYSISGTWVANSDSSKVTFTLPTPPSEFIFLNRQWSFIKYSSPIMELGYSANSGGEYKILHFQKQ